VATRRTTALTVVAVVGCLALTVGSFLVYSGVSSDHDGRTVGGILLGLVGLICFRILHWVRKIRLMTQAGQALHVDDPGIAHQDKG
jgi:hypothetical protein